MYIPRGRDARRSLMAARVLPANPELKMEVEMATGVVEQEPVRREIAPLPTDDLGQTEGDQARPDTAVFALRPPSEV